MQQDLLLVAVQLRDLEICRILLSEGRIDPLSALIPSDNGQLVMKTKPRVNEKVILQLLLEHAMIKSTL